MPSRASRLRFPSLLIASLRHFEAHRAGRTLYHAHGRFDGPAIEILELLLGDLPDLFLAHRTDAAAPGGLGAAVDLGRLLEKVGNRRGPHLERERAVLIDRDHDRDRRVFLQDLRLRIERLAEFYYVDPGWTQRRSNRRRRVRGARRDLQLEVTGNLLGHLQLLHLPELELDRGSPAEDRDRNLDPRAGIVDFLDDAVERGERPVGHPNLLAHFESDRGFRPLDPLLHLVQNSRRLGVRDRHRLLVGAEKAGDLRRILDEVIGLVRQIHLHQHITGEELALRIDLAAPPDLHDLFLRDHDVLEQVRQPALARLLADRVRHLLLEIRVSVDDVPALRHNRKPVGFHSAADAQYVSDRHADELIGNEEENRGQRHHYEYHRGCDRGFPPRGPGDLLG